MKIVFEKDLLPRRHYRYNDGNSRWIYVRTDYIRKRIYLIDPDDGITMEHPYDPEEIWAYYPEDNTFKFLK